VISSGSALLVIFLVGGVLVLAHRLSGAERTLLAQAAGQERSAGCDPVRTVPPYSATLDRAHVGTGSPVPRMPLLSTYRSVPPVSGPHFPVPLGAGVYRTPPPIGQALQSLEHAAVTVWFSPSLSDPERTRIERFFAQKGEANHVIVAPYSYPAEAAAGQLPAGQQMVLAAWHHLQSCARPSLAVAFAFVHSYRFDLYQWGAYKGDAPEKFAPI
jgi:hypothetical protein